MTSKLNANLFELSHINFNKLTNSNVVYKKFLDISSIQNGFAFKSSEYTDKKDLKILRTKNMKENNIFSSEDVKYISNSSKNKYKKFSFNTFDTTIVMVGASLGKQALITSNVLPALQNQNMWRFRSKDKIIPGLYIYELVKSINYKVNAYATGSARQFYKKNFFEDTTIPVIDNKKYEIFFKIQEKIDNNICQNETLTELKKLLIEKIL